MPAWMFAWMLAWMLAWMSALMPAWMRFAAFLRMLVLILLKFSYFHSIIINSSTKMFTKTLKLNLKKIIHITILLRFFFDIHYNIINIKIINNIYNFQ